VATAQRLRMRRTSLTLLPHPRVRSSSSLARPCDGFGEAVRTVQQCDHDTSHDRPQPLRAFSASSLHLNATSQQSLPPATAMDRHLSSAHAHMMTPDLPACTHPWRYPSACLSIAPILHHSFSPCSQWSTRCVPHSPRGRVQFGIRSSEPERIQATSPETEARVLAASGGISAATHSMLTALGVRL